MKYILIVDAFILAVLLWRVLAGRKNGAVHMFSGAASVTLGVIGGHFAKKLFANILCNTAVLPWVQRLLSEKQIALGIDNLADGLENLLSELDLPAAFLHAVVEEVTGLIEGVGDDLLSATAEVIAMRISNFILAVLGFVLVFIVALLILRLISATLMKLPILRQVDSLLGMVFGAVAALVTCGVILLAVYKIAPTLQAPGALFSPESVQGSFITKLYFKAFPGSFRL